MTEQRVDTNENLQALVENPFDFPVGEDMPPEWLTPSSSEKQLSVLKDEIVLSPQNEIQPPKLTAEKKQQVFEQLKLLLTKIEEDRENHSQEEVVSILYLVRLRLAELGLFEADIPPDILEKMKSMVDTFDKDNQRKQELLIELQSSLSEAPINIDASAIVAIEPAAITQMVSSEDGKELNITQAGEDGKEKTEKVDEKGFLLALLIVALSDQFLNTNHMHIIVEELGSEGGRFIMAKLGLSKEAASATKLDKAAVDFYLQEQTTDKLLEFLTKALQPGELANFLRVMDSRDTALLLTDNMFGQYAKDGSVRHDFNPTQTNEVLSKLTADQYFQILRRFTPDAIELYFEHLNSEDKKKLLAGEAFGPYSNLRLTSEQLAELTDQLSADDKTRLLKTD